MTENKITKRNFVKQWTSSSKELVGFDFVRIESPLQDLSSATNSLHSIAEVNKNQKQALSPKILAEGIYTAARGLETEPKIYQTLSVEELTQDQIEEITGKVLSIKNPFTNTRGLMYATVVTVESVQGKVISEVEPEEDVNGQIIPFDPNFRAKLVRSGVSRIIEGVIIEPDSTKSLDAA